MKKFIMKVSLSLIVLSVVSVFSFAKGNVAILGVGGTIAGESKSTMQVVGYDAAVISISTIIERVPEISDAANIVLCEQIAQIDSKDLTDDIWLKLAKRTNQLLSQKDIDGIVITHNRYDGRNCLFFESRC
jgi:L-asparaginase